MPWLFRLFPAAARVPVEVSPSQVPVTALTFTARLRGFLVKFSPCAILAASRLIYMCLPRLCPLMGMSIMHSPQGAVELRQGM